MSFLESLHKRQIAIIGGGVTGAGIFEFLKVRSIKATIVDEKSRVVSGFESVTEVPAGIDFAIVSPGWKLDHPFIAALKSNGAEILSEIDFAWRVKSEIAPHQKWIALTGTNGKTTTIQMVAAMMQKGGLWGVACGNVGDTVIEALSGHKPYDVLALELSSFQIEWSKEARFSACAILNIAEDHIDWHGSFDSYANSKLSLLSYSDLAVLNAEDVEVATRSVAWQGKKVFYSLETPAPDELGLVENLLVDRAFIDDPAHAEAFAELADITPTVPHNVSNAMAAAGLARSLGISHDDIKEALKSFSIDHHRLETVLDKDGVRWVNDSKATNPHAAIASILSHEKVIWIAGGLAKGASMDQLVQRAAPRLAAAILIGTDKDLIHRALKAHAPQVPVMIIENQETPERLMEEIIKSALSMAKSGDAVLLAPACASMDQFTSYSHRGNLFSETVKKIVGA